MECYLPYLSNIPVCVGISAAGTRVFPSSSVSGPDSEVTRVDDCGFGISVFVSTVMSFASSESRFLATVALFFVSSIVSASSLALCCCVSSFESFCSSRR